MENHFDNISFTSDVVFFLAIDARKQRLFMTDCVRVSPVVTLVMGRYRKAYYPPSTNTHVLYMGVHPRTGEVADVVDGWSVPAYRQTNITIRISSSLVEFDSFRLVDASLRRAASSFVPVRQVAALRAWKVNRNDDA